MTSGALETKLTFVNADKDGTGIMSFRTRREKVAILLAALSKDTAVELLKKLDVRSVKQLADSATRLGPLNTHDVDPVIDEFLAEFSQALGISAGVEQIVPLLESAYSKEMVSEILGTSKKPDKPVVWQKFKTGMEQHLVPYLLDEDEQTTAAILCRIPVEISAMCYGKLPREMTSKILLRTLKARDIHPAALRCLEAALEQDFFSSKTESGSNDNIEKVASVVTQLERNQALDVMETLSKLSPEQAVQLRKLIFMFEDVVQLDDRSRAKLLDRVPSELIVPALWGTDQAFKESVLATLSARTRRMVEAELAGDDGNPHKDASNARRKIAEMAVAMSRRGELVLPGEGAAQKSDG
jgi:flagellar motor switch protein FliG